MADDESKQTGQDEIEELLREAKAGEAPEEPIAPAEPVADSGAPVTQSEVEALLKEGSGATADAKSAQQSSSPGDTAAPATSNESATPAAAPQVPPTTPASSHDAGAAAEEGIAQADVELLLNQAEQALASVDNPPDGPLPTGFRSFDLEDFGGAPPSSEAATIELIRDVELDLKIELGRTHMHLEEVLKLRKGSVVPLDKLAGDPVDIYVNGRLIARGEVLVLNDNFCVRVGELIAGESAAAG